MEMAIEIQNVCKTYPGRTALKNISFAVKKGSVHGFLGPNGAGKSTTMKILSGLIPATSGHFSVAGRVGFLPEHPPLYSNMNVGDYLAFVLSIYATSKSFSPREIASRVSSVMEKTKLHEVAHRLIGNLSKGYQQRVGIAQAIIHSPDIIILDEPTVGLDPKAIVEIRALISELKKDHTILFSSHQLHEVELLCSDITLINNGEIVVSGSMESILAGLKSNMSMKARVMKFDEDQKQKMVNQFGLDFVEVKSSIDSEDLLLTIATKTKRDQRAELAHFLSDRSIGLLELTTERGDLEELFKRMGP